MLTFRYSRLKSFLYNLIRVFILFLGNFMHFADKVLDEYLSRRKLSLLRKKKIDT